MLQTSFVPEYIFPLLINMNVNVAVCTELVVQESTHRATGRLREAWANGYMKKSIQ